MALARPGPGEHRSGKLVERDEALATLRRSLDEAATAGRIVLVRGEAGLGKTALLRAFVEDCLRGIDVFWGACDGVSTPQPYGPFEDMADALGTEFRRLLDSNARRSDLGAVVTLVLALAAAAPATAAQPTRTVYPAEPVSHYPAGEGCAFGVTAYKLPGARTTMVEFSDGTLVFEAHSMHRRIISDVTGIEYDENIQSHEVDHVDGSGIDHGSINGQFIWTFLVGDAFIDGTVMDHVTSLDMVGRATYVVDWDTGQTLRISFVGRYTDICAALS